MVTKFGTLFARADFENDYHYHNVLGQKMTVGIFISVRERPLFKVSLWPFLEHGARGHFDSVHTHHFECGVGWIVLNDGVTMFIGEHCEVIFCA